MIEFKKEEESRMDTIRITLRNKESEIDILKNLNKSLSSEIIDIKESNKANMKTSILSFDNKLKLFSQREEFYIFEIKRLKEEIQKQK